MELGLTNKKVLVTGSTSGIGKAIASAFLEEDACVLINGRNPDKLKVVQTEFEAKHGKDSVLCFCGDMTERCTIQKCMQYAESEWGKLDVLIPNLGTGKANNSDWMQLDEWKYMMERNLYSAVELVRMFSGLLEKGADSNIVFLSSVVAYERASAPYAYAAAKGSLLTLNSYLAADYAKKNIRINCVVPGNVYFENGRWAEILSTDKEGTEKYIENNVPMNRFGKPEEIANAVVFLASEKSSFTTGATLVVDGGQKRSI